MVMKYFRYALYFLVFSVSHVHGVLTNLTITSAVAGIADPQTAGVTYGSKTFLNYVIQGESGSLVLNNTAGNSGVAAVAAWGDALDFGPVAGMTYVPRSDTAFQIVLEARNSDGGLTRLRADDGWGFGVTDVADARRIEWISTKTGSESIVFTIDLSNFPASSKLLITGLTFGKGRELANARVSGFSGNASGTVQDSGVFGTNGSDGTLSWTLPTPIEVVGGGIGLFSLSQATQEGAGDSEDNGFSLQGLAFDIVPMEVGPVGPGVESSILYRDADGRLVYSADEAGNRIVDFSHAGYHAGEKALPTVAVVKTISPVQGDNTAHIQAAIDEVAARTPNQNGHRGAILLRAGVYEMLGPVYVRSDGIVLRGEGRGSGSSDTVLVDAAGKRVEDKGLIIIESSIGGTIEEAGTRQNVTSDYIPAGCRTFAVEDASRYRIGDLLIIEHQATAAWLDAINYGNTDGDAEPWVPFQADLRMTFHGNVTAIEGNQIKFDSPIYHALDRSLSQAQVFRHSGRKLIRECGVENLRGFSRTTSATDENHLWDFVHFLGAENCWAKNATAVAFADSGFRFTRSRRSTVLNCSVLEPVSQVTGGRRYNFYVGSDSHDILFKGCVASEGRHCFVANGAANVNGIVFTQSESLRAYSTSENHRRWGSAMLWDNLSWIGASTSTVLGFYNRGNAGTSHGWTGTGLVAWNIEASGRIILCEKPPVGQNFAVGCNATVRELLSYPGWIEATGQTLSIPSLYEAQLAERLTYGVGPDAPAKLKVAYYDNGIAPYVALQWMDTAMDEEEFIIERSSNGGRSFAEIRRVPAQRETAIDRSVTRGRAYTYRVRASNGVGKSAYSNVAEVNLSIPDREQKTVYQAEYYDNAAQATLDWSTYRYTGKGHMAMDGAGAWIELRVDGGSGGLADLTLRYRAFGSRTVGLLVNGQALSDLSIPASAEYSPPGYTNKYRDFSEFTQSVNLQPGMNTIRLELKATTNTLYLDRLELSQLQRVEGLAIGYASWAAVNGLTGGPQADDDGDQVSNFEEYVFNGAPKDSNDPGFLPQVSLMPDKAMITYVRRKEDLSLVYEVQSSRNLQTWENGASLISRVDEGDYERVTEIHTLGTPALFTRVLITQE
jgi:hypothetical protein